MGQLPSHLRSKERGEVARYPLLAQGGGFDIDGFRRALSENTGRRKLFVLFNFPNNPTGYSVTPAEADAIAEALASVR